jgi:UDP-2-acetamido-3-amino-2,3-dideoxy-glucuronate N-acetyltransferase
MATAVFGGGYWGNKIIRILKEDVAVIYDTHQATLDGLDEEFSDIPKVTSVDKVWKFSTVKRVVVVTPPHTHYDLIKDALTRGLDVYVEKPLVKSSAEAEELYALSQSLGRVLMVGHVTNYHPTVQVLLDRIRTQRYGSLRKIETQRLGAGFLRTDIDVMWDLGIHDVSVSLRLLKQGGFELDESSVRAMHSKAVGLHSDTVFAQANFTNKTIGKEAMLEIHTAWHNTGKERILRLVFENALISWDATKVIDDKTQLKVCEFVNGPPPAYSILLQEVETEFPSPSSTLMPLDTELLHFLDCCKNRSTPLTDGAEGIRVLKFLELVSACDSKRSDVARECEKTPVFTDNPNAEEAFVHPTSVVERGAKIGKGTRIWYFCHISKNCCIGDNCNVGQNCYFGEGTVLGNNSKVQNNVSVYDGVVCEDDVFLGPSMVFTNDRNPRSAHLRPFMKTFVKRGASIGANATIVCGTTLGEFCMVGAGAVVTKDVKPYALVYGNPARQRGWVDKDGNIAEEQLEVSPSIFPTFTASEEWKLIKQDVIQRTKNVFQEGRFINGPEVTELEKQLANFVGVPHCIGVGIGTDALQLALMAKSVSTGDEVIVPTLTYIATAEAVALQGAVPVFVDILPGTYNIDPKAVEEAISYKTKAVIAVSLFGEVAPLEEIKVILTTLGRNDIALIEDAAQSFGAERDGLKSCGIADISCTSFYPTKPLGCYGDGGAVFTEDEKIATKIRQLANHGSTELDVHMSLGFNSRLDTLQAAILLSKMKIISETLRSRHKVAQIYHEYLRSEKQLNLPSLNDSSVYAQFTMQLEDQASRDKLKSELEKAGIQTRIYWAIPVHLPPVFQQTKCIVKPCPVAESVCKESLSLPIYPYMKVEDTVRIAVAVKKALRVLNGLPA